MKIVIADSYQEMSEKAAQHLIILSQTTQQPLICTASGDTPTGLYQALVQLYQQQQFDPSQWRFVGLDEWANMNGSTQGSCRYYIDRQLFEPMHTKGENICFFDGTANNLVEECRRVECFIQTNGGIDIAILGLGMNGHLGMNEPGTSPLTRSHVTEIDSLTQQVGQKYFQQPQQLTHGVTLGLATLMEANHILLLVNGRRKAEIVKTVVEGSISQEVPATLLHRHPSCYLYLDADAAELLQDGAN
jgi:glucosamine-6-phosphate isomerase